MSPEAAVAIVKGYRTLVDHRDQDEPFTHAQVCLLVTAAERMVELHAHVSELLDHTIVDGHAQLSQMRTTVADLENAIRAEIGTNVTLATIVREHVPLVRPPATGTPIDPVILPFPPPTPQRIEAS